MRVAVLAGLAWVGLTAGALAQPGGQGAGLMDRLMAADANRDGAITMAEARAGREAQFRRADANGDGFVTAEERERRGEGKRGGGGGDANGDGKVSLAEFLNAPYRGFEMFDANRNDILEASELQAARDRFQQRKNGTP
jgi:hypothetical protein